MSIDVTQLTISLEEKERWRRTLSVTVPAPLVRQERDVLAQRLARRMKMKGFRSGRIPSAVVEKRYGEALNKEMLDRVIGEAYREALRAQELHPISEGELEDLKYAPETDLSFAISFDVRPEFDLARLGGFAVRRPTYTVSDEDVDRVIERLRVQHGSWTPIDEGTPEIGNLVSIAVHKLLDGEPDGDLQEYDLVLGDGDAIPDVEDAIRTLSLGESGDFTVTFPDDFPNEERRGERQHLRIRVDARKERELPELSDDFARALGDFQDLDALLARVREDLDREAEERAEMEVRGQLLQQLLEANAFDAPASMVDRYIEGIVGNPEEVNTEEIARAKEQIRPEADQAVKRILLIERVAETQGLRASEEDLDDRVEAIAAKSEVSPAEVYARFQKSGRLEALEREITERKVFEFLKEQSEIELAES